MATSTASKRVFNMSGHIMNSRRANLTRLSVSDMLFISSALKAKKEALMVGKKV